MQDDVEFTDEQKKNCTLLHTNLIAGVQFVLGTAEAQQMKKGSLGKGSLRSPCEACFVFLFAVFWGVLVVQMP